MDDNPNPRQPADEVDLTPEERDKRSLQALTDAYLEHYPGLSSQELYEALRRPSGMPFDSSGNPIYLYDHETVAQHVALQNAQPGTQQFNIVASNIIDPAPGYQLAKNVQNQLLSNGIWVDGRQPSEPVVAGGGRLSSFNNDIPQHGGPAYRATPPPPPTPQKGGPTRNQRAREDAATARFNTMNDVVAPVYASSTTSQSTAPRQSQPSAPRPSSRRTYNAPKTYSTSSYDSRPAGESKLLAASIAATNSWKSTTPKPAANSADTTPYSNASPILRSSPYTPSTTSSRFQEMNYVAPKTSSGGLNMSLYGGGPQ